MKHKLTLAKSIFLKLFTLIILFSAISCKKDHSNTSDNQNLSKSDYKYQEGDIVLGKKKKNPYTVRNMKQALIAVKKQMKLSSLTEDAIEPSHYYVKFKPQDMDQYEELEENEDLELSSVPIEYEVDVAGNRYHDPSLPAEVPTYQYTAVSKDFKFSDKIPYEIIDTLYIPEQDNVSSLSHSLKKKNNKLIDALLDQAYIQTENYQDTVKLSRVSNFSPAGRIRIFDTRLNTLIGLEGVRIQTRRWFTVHTGITDFNGNYRTGDFSRPCNYSLWFATDNFAVREHLFGLTSWIDGPKQSSNWDLDIRDGYDRFVGSIFRGAYRYHNKDIGGLQRPIRPSGNRTIYVGVDKSKDWSGVNWIVFPVIRIARYDGGNGGREYGTDEIFSTSCHETAHTSHVIVMNAGFIQYSQVSNQLQESWPVAVEWLLTGIEYKNRGIANYGEWNYHPTPVPQYPNDQAYQYWRTNLNSIAPTYTNLYINLVDNFNELNQWIQGYGNGVVNDQVSGYTLPFIEQNILKHSYGLSSLSTRLKANKPTGITDAQIDLLLSFY